MSSANRQLAAIVIAHTVGAHERSGELLQDIFRPYLKQYNGRLLKAGDDRLVLAFTSAVAEVNFALDVQRTLPIHQSDWPQGQRLRFRLGINLGDIVVDGDAVHGDGVDVAAGLGALVEPGGILIAGNVLNQVRRRLDHVAFEDMGPQNVANGPGPVSSYRVLLDPPAVAAAGGGGRLLTGRQLALALLVLILFSGMVYWKL